MYKVQMRVQEEGMSIEGGQAAAAAAEGGGDSTYARGQR